MSRLPSLSKRTTEGHIVSLVKSQGQSSGDPRPVEVLGYHCRRVENTSGKRVEGKTRPSSTIAGLAVLRTSERRFVVKRKRNETKRGRTVNFCLSLSVKEEVVSFAETVKQPKSRTEKGILAPTPSLRVSIRGFKGNQVSPE